MIYFDNAATSFPKPECVYTALDEANRTLAFNAGRGGYKGAKEAQLSIDELKNKLCAMVGITPEANSVLLTESATIASNIIIMGLDINESDTVYISPFEHNAIVRPLELLRKKLGFEIKIIPFTQELELDTDRFRHMLSLSPASHLFVSAVGNVLGNVINLRQILDIVKDNGTITVVDGAQALGLINIDMSQLEIDYFIFAGHKTLYGPLGIGGIISSKLGKLKPHIAGGTGSDSLNIETKRVVEIGSTNIVAVKGLLAAIDWIEELGQKKFLERIHGLHQLLISKLEGIYGVKIYGKALKLTNSTGIVGFSLEEYTANEIMEILDDEYGISVRAGFQCAPLVHDVLNTINLGGVVRVSLSYFNNEKQIEQLVRAIEEICET